MAMVEAPMMVSMGPTNVAALFGDDIDPQPLWFKKDAFGESDFDPEVYISDLRRFVPLETLRAELGSHLAVLKNELVELINRDYTDFVNLSTKLVDVDGAVLRMRMPLSEVRNKLVHVRDSVASSLALLQDGLRRRADALHVRQILELLLDTAHVLSKVEKLLLELEAMPEDGTGAGHTELANGDGSVNGVQTNNGNESSALDGGMHYEESRSRLLERIASEMNRLKFYTARAQDMPFIQNMEKRIAAADGTLASGLRRCLEGGLERRDKRVIYHCLRAYAAVDNTAGAEDAFRSAIVSPFMQQILQASSAKGIVALAGNSLAEIFNQVLKHVETDCRFLLDIAYTANSGLHAFDFLSNSVLKEVHLAIAKTKPSAFSPGKPAEFLSNYKASLQFLSALEEYCPSTQAVTMFRSQTAYSEFMKQWNLSVYFTLRFQEIAGAVDTALTSGMTALTQGGPLRVGEDGLELVLHSSAVLWQCLQRCWSDDVFILTVADKFLRLTLQLLSRYSLCICSGLNARKVYASGGGAAPSGVEWGINATPEEFILIKHDMDVISQLVTSRYIDIVVAAMAGMSEEAEMAVKKSIRQGAQSLKELVPVIADVLKEFLAEKSQEALKQMRGITATYRMTNKPLPTRHSPYVAGILQPLKMFVEGDRAVYMSEAFKADVMGGVVERVTARYDEMARELLTTARKTESSLKWLKSGRRGQGPHTSQGETSDTDKICAQLFLDVQEFGRQLAKYNVQAADVASYVALWQFVAPPERQAVDIGHL